MIIRKSTLKKIIAEVLSEARNDFIKYPKIYILRAGTLNLKNLRKNQYVADNLDGKDTDKQQIIFFELGRGFPVKKSLIACGSYGAPGQYKVGENYSAIGDQSGKYVGDAVVVAVVALSNLEAKAGFLASKVKKNSMPYYVFK